jgi:signal transduction histidine kinase
VHVERVVVDGAPLASTDVPPGRQRWEFHYTALSFLAPRKVRFRYRLEGFDPDWIEAGTQRAAYYTRLPPGRYTFQVSACNNDGVWNDEGASFSLRVRPYFHETPWFYALVALALAVAGAAAYGMRVRHLHARRRELEDQVEARTHDLLLEKERSEAARDEARRQKEIAEAADRTKTELLSIAAHELKSPLQSIIGYGELLGVAEDLARAREHASYSSAAARRMLHTIQQLLHSDAIERGALGTARGPVDLAGLAGSVVDALRPQAEAKRQTVEVSLPGPCVVEGDEEWLRQVVENLVGNAIKYSPPGSPITVEVVRTEAAVVLAVRDEGPGLTADDLAHVFGRFQRLSARPTGGEPATGLGLYLVKQVVERHRGRVWAESEGAGKGARFVVELPAAPDA